jgi:hypothetical protein
MTAKSLPTCETKRHQHNCCLQKGQCRGGKYPPREDKRASNSNGGKVSASVDRGDHGGKASAKEGLARSRQQSINQRRGTNNGDKVFASIDRGYKAILKTSRKYIYA